MYPKESTTFCSVPWTQLATNSSGYYRVCCNALPVKNLIKDPNGEVMRVYSHTVDEAWQSSTYEEIRKQMLNSVRPEMCTRCFREEDAGVESARQRWNKKYSLDALTSFASAANPEIKYVDLRLGNLCNLKCRMCNPYSSSKWVQEWNSVVGSAELVPNEKLSAGEEKRLLQMDWPDRPETWKNLMPILKSVEEIYLTGGEPFLSLRQKELLTHLVESGRSKHVTIKYNTNLTVYPETLVETWSQFKTVKLNCSIDGIGDLNEYIRYPTRWDVVLLHLQKFKELKKQGIPIEIGIHTTVQIYNIFSLAKILEYFKEEFASEPYLNILNHPACLNIRALPAGLKNAVVTSLRNYSNNKSVAEVIAYMQAEDWSATYWPQFCEYTQKLDENRRQKWSLVCEHQGAGTLLGSISY